MFTRILPFVGLLLALVASAQEGPVPDPMTRRAVPADGHIRITEYGYRDWEPQLLHYRVDTRVYPPGASRLLDAAGAEVPCQISADGVLSFVGGLALGQTAAWRLEPGAPAAAPAVTATPTATALELANSQIALRLPLPGSTAVQPPLLAWRPAGLDWMGSAAFVGEPQPQSATYAIVEQGPAWILYEARYRFAPMGEYVCRVSLAAGMPLAVISEEFDLGRPLARPLSLCLNLQDGWQPAAVRVFNEANKPPAPLADYVAQKLASGTQAPPVGGVGQPPTPHPPRADLQLLEKIVPGGRWGGYGGGIALLATAPADATADAATPTVTLATLHLGAWRRTMSLTIWQDPQAGLVAELPIGVRPMRWSLDIADEFSPFSTHEHDDALPRTYGRRVWALSTLNDARVHLTQHRYGVIGLDRYKDWLLDLPELTADDVKRLYPGGMFTAAQIAHVKANLDAHPDRAELARWYLISGDPADAERQARFMLQQLTARFMVENHETNSLSHYRQAQMRGYTLAAEDALAYPDLDPALRRELRLRLAIEAHLLSEPDFNPRGSGVHLGNNNMTINRTLGLSYYVAVLPDHPRFAYWADQLRIFAQYKFSSQTAPDGGWIACPAYQLYSPTRALNLTQIVLRNRGVHDFAPAGYHLATLRYLAWMTMVDLRFPERRIIPGMGNSANRQESIWGTAMAALPDTAAADLAFLRAMQLASIPQTRQKESRPTLIISGDDGIGSPLWYRPDVAPAPLDLSTRVVPTYGVMFRHATGSARETAMLLRGGMNWSHWDPDNLNVVVYSHGSPLSPGTGYQYLSAPVVQANGGIYHNRLKVGDRDQRIIFGRVDSAVRDYGFGPGVDYAMAQCDYPKQAFADAAGDAAWRRHVLFVKNDDPAAESYFVLRDTVRGEPARRSWWNWLNLNGPENIAVDGQAFAADAVAMNAAIAEADLPRRSGQVLTLKSGASHDSWMWFSRPREFRVRAWFDYPRQDGLGGREQKSIIEVPAAAGEDYHYLLYPLEAGAQPPTVSAMADGVLRVTTAASADTLFIADEPLDYAADDVVFQGRAGAVRLYTDRVVLALNSGSGRVGYRGHILTGDGPFERTIKLTDLTAGEHPIAGGYAKEQQVVDLADGLAVRGEGPFRAELDGQVIRIQTQGRARVLYVDMPLWMARPHYRVDGQEWMACWTDYPDSGWGGYDRAWLVGLSVPDGEHTLELRDLRYPPVWSRTFTPTIAPQAPPDTPVHLTRDLLPHTP